MVLIRPCKERILSYIGIGPKYPPIETPTACPEEWGKNHKAFVLRTLLPEISPPEYIWKIAAEAYLTKFELSGGEIVSFEEILSDGSSLVPDMAYENGMIKDPWAVAHDFVFFLNRLSLEDAFGERWTLRKANRMYRDGWYCQGFVGIGTLWWMGLCVFSWIPWGTRFKNRPEPIEDIIEK